MEAAKFPPSGPPNWLIIKDAVLGQVWVILLEIVTVFHKSTWSWHLLILMFWESHGRGPSDQVKCFWPGIFGMGFGLVIGFRADTVQVKGSYSLAKESRSCFLWAIAWLNALQCLAVCWSGYPDTGSGH